MIKDYKLCAIAFFAVAVLIPLASFLPGSPVLQPTTMSAADLAQSYVQNQTSIIWFSLLSGIVAILWAPFVAVVAVAMMQMRPRSFLLIFIHVICGITMTIAPLFGTFFFTAAAFHPQVTPDVILALHDTGKFFLLGVMPFIIGAPVLAIAILKDRSPNPILPKWLAWVNIIYAITTQTYTFAPLFPSGPFSLDGSIGMILPLILLELYIVLTAIAMYRINPEQWREADMLPVQK